MNIMIEQGSDFVVDDSRRLFFGVQEAKKVSERTAGTLINAHRNGLRVRQLCRLGKIKMKASFTMVTFRTRWQQLVY